MFRLLGVLLLMMSATGCGTRYPETATVTGKVTYKGQPLPLGRVSFWPPQGRPAAGEIKPDGTYTLTSFRQDDGAIPGIHRVSITARRAIAAGAGPSSSSVATTPGWGDNPAVEWLIPKHYEQAETSNLTAEVRPGKNTIDFDLSP